MRAAFACSVLILAGVALQGAAFSQSQRKLVAPAYPGAVPQYTEGGKPAPCGETTKAGVCFLTRDSAEKVVAFYKQQGLRMDLIPQEQLRTNDFYASLFNGLLEIVLYERDEIGALYMAPVEFHDVGMGGSGEGANEGWFFTGVLVMGHAPRPALAGDAAAQLKFLSNDPIFGPITQQSPDFETLAQQLLQLLPDQLAPLYNKNLPALSGYYQSEDRTPRPARRLDEARKQRGQQMAGTMSGNKANEKSYEQRQSALDDELFEILAGKPDKQSRYMNLEVQQAKQEDSDPAGDKRTEAQKDQLLMSDPELAAWKRKRDALNQDRQKGRAQADQNRDATQAGIMSVEQRRAAIQAYLAGLAKEAYPTRILIQQTMKRNVTRDGAAVAKAWQEHYGDATAANLKSARPSSASKPAAAPPPAAQAAPAQPSTKPAPPPEQKESTGDTLQKGAAEGFKAIKKLF